MKNIKKLFLLLLVLCMTVSVLVACDQNTGDGTETETSGNPSAELPEWVDYASQLKLNMNSPTAKIEIPASDIKQYIDGDTTHFYVPASISKNGILKARYLAVNTPESTGMIEEWGKKASNFTKEKLKSAVSIVIESDTATWNYDSTGDRLLVWIWYKTSADGEYINLNLQLLQEGLAIASNSANNIYGEYCMNAISQAKAYKLYVYSEQPDPDFYYGEAQELTIKELRVNAEKYAGTRVAFEGIVVKNSGSNGVYVEAYDEETGMYNGIYVYYGFSFNQLSVIKPGNKVRIVGSMQFYEAGGTYQIADLKYDMMDSKNPNNVQKLGEGFEASYKEVTPETFATGKVSVTVIDDGEEIVKDVPYAEMALSASISMKGLKVDRVYTTNNGGDSDGAMTLTCSADGYEISVRTSVLKNENGDLVTEDYFIGKTIDVKGTVDYYNGSYQIEVTSLSDIIIH
jgi:endonuclease YncB( thermonuclease family)